MSRFLASALVPDLTVNCAAPGLTEVTKMSSGASDAYVGHLNDREVSGRTTSVDDVLEHVQEILVTSMVTGQVLITDGGNHFG
ncbi:hypothetical protein [Silicimonas sp. MF1-12-2]|uniref:hypothetical protein n=1 Tax=Silicimonas sp. MF1-12-2 TaxID=3384793 RepID=UPI0039B40081